MHEDARVENPVDTLSPDAAPAALTDLIASGLISHEIIGDPALLGAETPVLARLCELIEGPVYRIDAFHYAFQARAGDLGGELGARPVGDWTAALAAAVRGALGEEAVWLTPIDPLPETQSGLDQPLLLLRAHAEAVATTLEAAGPGQGAAINARYASETARMTATQVAGAVTEAVTTALIGATESGQSLAARLGAIEARQEEILGRIAAAAEAPVQDADPLLVKLTETLAEITRRLEDLDLAQRAQGTRLEALAEGLATAGSNGTSPGEVAARRAFEETLGLSLAEFLAQLDYRTGQAGPTPMPRLS